MFGGVGSVNLVAQLVYQYLDDSRHFGVSNCQRVVEEALAYLKVARMQEKLHLLFREAGSEKATPQAGTVGRQGEEVGVDPIEPRFFAGHRRALGVGGVVNRCAGNPLAERLILAREHQHLVPDFVAGLTEHRHTAKHEVHHEVALQFEQRPLELGFRKAGMALQHARFELLVIFGRERLLHALGELTERFCRVDAQIGGQTHRLMGGYGRLHESRLWG